jgi:hypothetical protein
VGMADRGVAELTAILREARALVGGDDDALARELDLHVERLRSGPIRMWTVGGLFLPTGPLQELAIEHGWGDAFLALADRFDALEIEG